jgi:uncharacterized membrane protein YhiD involved in acid resistance
MLMANTIEEIALRLGLATLIGLLLGLDRELRGQAMPGCGRTGWSRSARR